MHVLTTNVQLGVQSLNKVVNFLKGHNVHNLQLVF